MMLVPILLAAAVGSPPVAEWPLTVRSDDSKQGHCIVRKLPAAEWRGRIIRASVEAKGEIGIPSKKWEGGKFMVSARSGARWDWPQATLPSGRGPFDWRNFSFEHFYDWDVEEANLVLGFQAAAGELVYRQPKFETLAAVLDLRQVANRAYADEVANDGIGGWSDQGRENDAREFDFRQKRFAGIPFRPLDPSVNGGKSCLVMKSGSCDVPSSAVVPGHGLGGRYLHLLHTICFGTAHRVLVGTVTVRGKNGRTQVISVEERTDVGDWWMAGRLPNGFPAASWKTSKGGLVSLYASKWPLDAALGPIAEITFQAVGLPTWIVVAGSLTDGDLSWPDMAHRTIVASERWRPLARSVFPCPVTPGSALDLSFVHPMKTDRVRLRNGRFTNETTGSEMRFVGDCQMYEILREDPEAWCREARRRGFNLVRLHYLDWMLSGGAEKPLAYNRGIEAFYRLLDACNRVGIYVNFDCMASPWGWTPGDPWSVNAAKPPTDDPNWVGKREIYFNPSARANWRAGVAKLLGSRNPVTGRLVRDEPCLLLAVAFNEQEFAFFGPPFGDPRIAASWRKFLCRRYGTVDRLNAAWKTSYSDFSSADVFELADVTDVTRLRGRDAMLFMDDCQTRMQDWYVRQFRQMTTNQYLAAFNMAQSLRLLSLRNGSDYVAMNAYQSHPSGSSIDATSGLERRACLARAFASTHLAEKPIVISEYGQIFWNPYRYEQGFVMGGYGALNGFDGMCAFARSVSTLPNSRRVSSFDFRTDPVMYGASVVNALLYGRGDVRESSLRINYTVDRDRLKRSNDVDDAMSDEQSVLALVGEIRVWVDRRPSASERSISLPVSSGNAVLFHDEGYQQSVERGNRVRGSSSSKIIAELRHRGLLPATNRTDPAKGVYESDTGELLLDAHRRFMSVNTPRFQGVASVAASAPVRFADVEIVRMTTDGSLFVASVDGLRPIREARRLLVGYITNAFNTEMTFEGDSYARVLDLGRLPVLAETGAFELVIGSAQAEGLRAYALDFSGNRLAQVPLTGGEQGVRMSFDTRRFADGVVGFFEIVDEKAWGTR